MGPAVSAMRAQTLYRRLQGGEIAAAGIEQHHIALHSAPLVLGSTLSVRAMA